MNNFSRTRGFDPTALLSWIRSEVAERYRPARRAPQHDPWWQLDPDHDTAFAYVDWAVTW